MGVFGRAGVVVSCADGDEVFSQILRFAVGGLVGVGPEGIDGEEGGVFQGALVDFAEGGF